MKKSMKQRSLGELEELYQRKLQYWANQKLAHEKKIEECRREMAACEAKLRHVQALIGGQQEPAVADVAPGRRPKQKRRRKSPVREATLQALRNRPGERLTTRQLLAAIRQDTRKKVSRQSVNVNVGILEQQGLIRRDPAPRGSGSRFVYSAV